MLRLQDPPAVPKFSKTLYQYVKDEYLGTNALKHCQVWTSKLLHLGHHVTSTAESAHWSIKRRLESPLGDIALVVKAIHRQLDDQLEDLHLIHEKEKSGYILPKCV